MNNHKPGTNGSKIDYSPVTPATGTNPNNKPIDDSLANTLPTADSPYPGGTIRTDPDKTIPGPEAATGVDRAEEDRTERSQDQSPSQCCRNN